MYIIFFFSAQAMERKGLIWDGWGSATRTLNKYFTFEASKPKTRYLQHIDQRLHSTTVYKKPIGFTSEFLYFLW